MDFLEVFIFGERVGVLSYDKNKMTTFFEYDKKFLQNKWELSPLIAPKSTEIRAYSYNQYDSYKGLPEFIADSLPDKFGNQVLEIFLFKNNKATNELTPLELLSYRGDRAMGALEFKPSLVNTNDSALNLLALSKLSNEIVNNQPIGKLNNDLLDLFEVGTSPGGAQPKILIHIDEHNNIFRGDKKPKSNQASYILKFNNLLDDFQEDKGKVEYLYYLMAQESGIEIAQSKLIQVGNQQVFATKRFDREKGDKIHMQTLMSYARFDWKNPIYSYEDIFKVLQFNGNSQKERQELFRRMVFNIAFKNVDDHTKNFSFIMDKEGKWKLSPAYDLLFTAKYKLNPTRDKNFLTVNGKREAIKQEDLKTIASDFGVLNHKEIIEQVVNSFEILPKQAKQLKISQKKTTFITSKIRENLRQIMH